jgi:cell fate (sporulation/competence/biofilm development) regulator YlbF (YheA/YmcA/DUF963 family)
MQTTTQDNAILLKTRELCQAILDRPETREALQRIETFMTDDAARAQYEGLMSKGQTLNQKQQRSIPLTDEEISSFEKDRDALLNNPVARGFLDAQEELRAVQQSVTKYVTRTLELGRVPAEEDFDSCACGHACGGGH